MEQGPKEPRAGCASAPAPGYAAFVFDVESIGLHGEAFAVAGGIYDEHGRPVEGTEFRYAIPRHRADGRMADRRWVDANIPDIPVTHQTADAMRDAFWSRWVDAKKSGAFMAVECRWPVEANFLHWCIRDNPSERTWEGPYPLHEIATEMVAAGLDPMSDHGRLACELPKHDPLADARHSARLLAKARRMRHNGKLSGRPENGGCHE